MLTLALQTKIPYSNEALDIRLTGGGQHSRALRRCFKRRSALSDAKPYAVAIIGFCDAYLYCKGVLCYTIDDTVRILDLRNSAQNEAVISIPRIIAQALSDVKDHCKGTFQILYYSDHIISCLYKSSGSNPTAWLIVFGLNPKRLLLVKELESTDKIFVRHDKQYLYYGTHSELGTDGYKRWAIQGYDFRDRKWFGQKIQLPDLVGSDVGSTICFEFYNGFLYGLSNQTSFEVEEIDWTSFYHCIRFPLASPCQELLEKTPHDHTMWRRQHQEGPIDDRWTNLRLDVDEGSGKLKIVESRKEWYLGSSKSQRTYYTADVVFPGHYIDENINFPLDSLDPEIATSPAEAYESTSAAIVQVTASAVTASSSSGGEITHDLTALPPGQLKLLLDKSDNPFFIEAPPRRPECTHPGNDGSKQPTFTLARSKIRSYYIASSTFMDVVDDSLPTNWQGEQRLRLRVGSRRLGPPLVYEEGEKKGLLRPPSKDLTTALKEMYRESEVTLWPPALDPDHPDPNIDALYTLLNPSTHLGNVQGTSDERSLVYVTGDGDAPQAIVFISFDPATKLEGVKRWGGLDMKGVGEGPHVDGRANGCTDEFVGNNNAYIDVEEGNRTVVIDRKGKGKESTACPVRVAGSGEVVVNLGNDTCGPHGSRIAAEAAERRTWGWKESAMYRDIKLGFYFGR